MTAKHEEQYESAAERSTDGRGSSSEGTERTKGTMSFSEMRRMMEGMSADEISRMMRECCPDGSDCDCCDWMLRRTFADSREAKED